MGVRAVRCWRAGRVWEADSYVTLVGSTTKPAKSQLYNFSSPPSLPPLHLCVCVRGGMETWVPSVIICLIRLAVIKPIVGGRPLVL